MADIDRGGVFAQIVGTLELLAPHERAMVKGVVINKFRGDASLLKPGIDFVEERTGVPVLGVIPYFTGFRIPEEDSVALVKRGTRTPLGLKDPDPTGPKELGTRGDKIHVGVVRLPHISNYTDFDALEREGDVELRYLEGPADLGALDLLIIPGSKATIADFQFLRKSGLADTIRAFAGPVAGICGGYQMLGRKVLDPLKVESHLEEIDGLGLLDARTTMLRRKETHQVTAQLQVAGTEVAPGCSGELSGYEIHMGETLLGSDARPFAAVIRRSGEDTYISDGAVSADGRVFGTYLHGIFDNASFRTTFLNRIRRQKGLPEGGAATDPDDPFDLLADHLERHLDMRRLLDICGMAG